MNECKLPPIHPGEILVEEFLEPLGISQYRLAKDVNVPARRINEIVQGKRAITPDTALRLCRYFGLSEHFWLNLQTRYDLEVEKDRLADRLEREVPVVLVPTRQFARIRRALSTCPIPELPSWPMPLGSFSCILVGGTGLGICRAA